MNQILSQFKDKQKIIHQFISHFESEALALKQAAVATYEAATNEESKAENEYDTRGLEASYLAGAQAERVSALEELIYQLKEIRIKYYSEGEPISSTAIVELELNGKNFFVILLPKGGGLTLNFKGVGLQIVTPQSPLGEALMGSFEGDTVIVDVGRQTKEYDILSVF